MFIKKSSNVKYIVVGLGNPGDKYLFTRHNAGFLALDFISQKLNFKINTVKFKSLSARASLTDKNGEKVDVLFLKPSTFMNNSGEAVRDASNFYKVPPQNILVIFDDISLPPGKIRMRRIGTDGGHNGIKSIISHLKTNEFPRIKIGIGNKPHPEMDLADYVLSNFTTDDKKIVLESLEKVFDAFFDIVVNEVSLT